MTTGHSAPGEDWPGDCVNQFVPSKQFQRKTANWIPRQTLAHNRFKHRAPRIGKCALRAVASAASGLNLSQPIIWNRSVRPL